MTWILGIVSRFGIVPSALTALAVIAVMFLGLRVLMLRADLQNARDELEVEQQAHAATRVTVARLQGEVDDLTASLERQTEAVKRQAEIARRATEQAARRAVARDRQPRATPPATLEGLNEWARTPR